MCYIANSKKERIKQTAAKDITVYKIAALIGDHLESIYYDYKYFPNIINKYIKLHYKKYTYIHKRLPHAFKGHVIYKGYYSYINKELCISDLSYSIMCASVKYGLYSKSTPLIVYAKCIIPKGTKYCINKKGIVISETLIYTGVYNA